MGFAIDRPVLLPHTPVSSPNRLSSSRLHLRSTVEEVLDKLPSAAHSSSISSTLFRGHDIVCHQDTR
jgi:hypothetical protein